MALVGLAAKMLLRSVPLVSRNASTVHGASVALDALDWLTALNRLHGAVGVLRFAREHGASGVAEEMVRRMRGDVAVDSGDLRDSIDFTRGGYVPDHPNVRGAAASIGTDENTIVVHAGSFDAFYAAFVEDGTVNMDAQPFFWQNARDVMEEFGLEIAQALDAAGQTE